ncbi:hypothetical protein G6F22_017594 [Rhizopus arrhizus]|nr:hypothetical protein G6F22_017594 [Rhizopus arrhizus]
MPARFTPLVSVALTTWRTNPGSGLARGDVGLVARHRLRVGRVLVLHLRQRADLLADDVLLAGVAQRGHAHVQGLQHKVQAAHLGGRRGAEVLLIGQIQVAAVQAVVTVVVAIAVRDDHAGRDVDLDVASGKCRQLIVHVDIDRAGRAVQAGLARAQQLFQNGLDDGRVRIELHRAARRLHAQAGWPRCSRPR